MPACSAKYESEIHWFLKKKNRSELFRPILGLTEHGAFVAFRCVLIQSIHSDTWKGTAADLAERGYIEVFPVLGWWRENPRHERWNKRARYSLVVSIKTPEIETELYSAVQNVIRQPVPITIS